MKIVKSKSELVNVSDVEVIVLELSYSECENEGMSNIVIYENMFEFKNMIEKYYNNEGGEFGDGWLDENRFEYKDECNYNLFEVMV